MELKYSKLMTDYLRTGLSAAIWIKDTVFSTDTSLCLVSNVLETHSGLLYTRVSWDSKKTHTMRWGHLATSAYLNNTHSYTFLLHGCLSLHLTLNLERRDQMIIMCYVSCNPPMCWNHNGFLLNGFSIKMYVRWLYHSNIHLSYTCSF